MSPSEPALTRESGEPARRWQGQRIALLALFFGLSAVAIAAVLLIRGASAPDGAAFDRWIVLVPAGLAALAACGSLLAREGTLALPAVAVCLAGGALVLGWVVVVGLVALGTAVVIAILSQLM